MKAISLTQPWATLVAIRAKRLETRGWHSNYRGPLAIHAAKKFSPEDRALCEREPFRSALSAAGYTADTLPLGAVVATAMLSAVRPITERNTPPEPERSFGNYSVPGRYAFVLDDVTPLPTPIPARGALSLWEWDEKGLNMSDDGPAEETPTPERTYTVRGTATIGEDGTLERLQHHIAAPRAAAAIEQFMVDLRLENEMATDGTLEWSVAPVAYLELEATQGSHCFVVGIASVGEGTDPVPVADEMLSATGDEEMTTEQAIRNSEMGVRKHLDLSPDAPITWVEGPVVLFVEVELVPAPTPREWHIKATGILGDENATTIELDVTLTALSDEEALLLAVCQHLKVEEYDLNTITWNDLAIAPGAEQVEVEEVPAEPPPPPLSLLLPEELRVIKRSHERDKAALVHERETLNKLLDKVQECRNRIRVLEADTRAMERLIPPEPAQLRLV